MASCAPALPSLGDLYTVLQARWHSEFPAAPADLLQALVVADLAVTRSRIATFEFQLTLASTEVPQYAWHPKLKRCLDKLQRQKIRDYKLFVKALRALQTKPNIRSTNRTHTTDHPTQPPPIRIATVREPGRARHSPSPTGH